MGDRKGRGKRQGQEGGNGSGVGERKGKQEMQRGGGGGRRVAGKSGVLLESVSGSQEEIVKGQA